MAAKQFFAFKSEPEKKRGKFLGYGDIRNVKGNGNLISAGYPCAYPFHRRPFLPSRHCTPGKSKTGESVQTPEQLTPPKQKKCQNSRKHLKQFLFVYHSGLFCLFLTHGKKVGNATQRRRRSLLTSLVNTRGQRERAKIQMTVLIRSADLTHFFK